MPPGHLVPFSAAPVRPPRRQCNSGVKDLVAVPPVGTRVSFFERSLLGPNSARLSPGPEGNKNTQLIPGQRTPMVFPGVERGSLGSMTYVLCLSYVQASVPTYVGTSCTCTAVRLGHRHTYHPRHLTPGRLGLPPYVSPSMPNAWTDLPLAPALCPLSTARVRSSRRHCNSGVKDGVTSLRLEPE